MVDFGVNFAPRFFSSLAATGVLSYTKAALSYTKVSTLKKTCNKLSRLIILLKDSVVFTCLKEGWV